MKTKINNRLLGGLLISLAGFVPVVEADTVTLDLKQAVKRAHNTDPRISEKEKLVDVGRGLLSEARGGESWIFDLNTFVGLAPDVKGGVF